MVRLLIIFFLMGSLLIGCGSANKQKELQEKESVLQQKERELQTREQELAVREQLLQQKEHRMDSTAKADSVQVGSRSITGNWTVQMTCTETTCPGSAVGDIKTEHWEIVQQANTIIARARVNEQLVRVYTGGVTDGIITLTEEQTPGSNAASVKMAVQLKPVSNTRIEGKREIIRENDCRIVYALQLDASTK